MSLFTNYIMQGFLKKKADQIKFWQKKLYYKRYYKIDFTSAVLFISEQINEEDDKKIKQVPFSHIQKCYEPKPENEIKIAEEIKSNTFKYPFYVKTLERLFLLFAPTRSERDMWVAGFEYIIVSTRQVQSILKINDKTLNTNMRKSTEKFKKIA